LTTLQSLFIENLRRNRVLCGLSQAELAERCNLSTNYISELEAGRRFPSAEKLQAFCDVFNIQPSELFAEGKTPTNFDPESRDSLSSYKERLKGLIAKLIDES
jgi:transcriptional regulator with XRE-family HTH domain